MEKIVKNKYIIATFLCIITYIIYLNIMKIYPFGEYSILKSDLYQQYINFFYYLKEIIVNGKSVFFSWNMGLANYFYTTFAYYLISPLNLLVIFFNTSNMDLFVELITLIKITLIANFTILFLEKSYNYKSREAVIFGLIYAFSSYVICYSFHIMWLDCLYMLPIVLVCTDRYIKTGKIWQLVLSLSYSILTNYYIGYIVAFFAGIYYIARSYQNKSKFKEIFKFILAIIISFGIGMIVILPSLMQLKGKMSANVKLIEIDIEKIKLFVNVIFNNYVYMFTQKSCFMFSSTIVILLLPMYYLNKNINKKEKTGFTAIIIFLLLPIISPFLNKMWHCFTTPNCFNYRYSFTLIFTLILMSAREFQNKKYTSKWHFLVALAFFTIMTSLELIFLNKGYLESDNYTVKMDSVIISCIVYFVIFALTYGVFYLKINKLLHILLIIVIIFDLIIGAKSGQNNNDKYFKRNVLTQYDEFMSYLKTKLQNPEIERIVFEPDEYGSNMSLKYGYSNIGFFTSARNREVLKSMYRMGYNVQMDEQLWITSYSGTFLNYSIAGVKYYVSKNPIDIYGFEFEEKHGDFYIYKNKNDFKIGYFLSENIEESYNPFKMQNDLLKGINNDNTNYFEEIEKSDCIKCHKTSTFDNSIQEYTITYSLEAIKDSTIYLASDYDLQVYVKGKPIFKNYSNIWSYETGAKQIKNLKKGEKFEFTIKTKQNLELLYIFVSDNEKIQKALDNRTEINNVEIKNNGLKGQVNIGNNGYIVFSIAYDKHWKVYIDGKKVKTNKIAGCFLGAKMKDGEHKIEIKAFY